MDIKIIGDACYEEFEKYKIENKAFLENNIVRSFLERRENQILFMNAICEPTKENNERLDFTFKRFYFNVRFTSFISSAIYFNAINFDKKFRRIQSRHPLTVDKEIGEEDEGTFKDLILDEKADICIDQILNSHDIVDYVEDTSLCEAIETLTEKQRGILNLAYVSGLSDTEIGRTLNKSQQAISKIRNKALQKILKHLQKKEGG